MRKTLPMTFIAVVLATAMLVTLTERRSTSGAATHAKAPGTSVGPHLLSTTWVGGHPIGVEVAGGLVYVQRRPTGSGNTVGLPVSCVGSCDPVCGPGPGPTLCSHASVLPKGWPSQVIADGSVFTSYGSGVAAFSPDCGVTDASCRQPLWTASGISSGRFGLSAGDGFLFVFQRHGGCCGNYAGPHGGILAYPTDCGTGNATCDPVWQWGTGQDGSPGVPIQAVAVTSDRLYAASGDGRLFVFGLGGTG